MLVNLASYQYCKLTYSNDKKDYVGEFSTYNLSKEHTYVTILNLKKVDGSDHNYQALIPFKNLREAAEDGRIKILYESPLAVNMVSGHGTHPRNVLIIFELTDDSTESKADPKDVSVSVRADRATQWGGVMGEPVPEAQ